ncbi:Gfo/Idh/MocA family oxidoreductase [Actinomadura sp. NEAU-AAG7]|uniref:Gfo/Idh/MocA family protein n=1 Tax=Actinomadura sp. NEAU-AAG7 TaxID=2839640 RepID=UPI001BE442E1|nr:Gfo/Idh/MocA family oxidoreductase [Actinomadura sp. NEAU-AAG7]MBT2211452.1 Gfo/Idh/MocA family oxidoreductase [Actinomadura sp. NEAU-AAG7]
MTHTTTTGPTAGLTIGLAGAGRIGARHAAALCELPEVGTLVIADVDPSRARALADRLSRAPGDPVADVLAAADAACAQDVGSARAAAGEVRVVAVDEVADLFSAGLDGVIVAAATDAHADLVAAALAGRIPVFCEKPLAPDLDGTFQIVAAADAARVPVQVGFQRRFDAGNAAAREALASGRLGWLHTVRSCSFDPAPPPVAYVPASGGLFRDCAIHDLDLIRFVTGREVVRVMASGANRGDAFFREYGDVDTGSVLLVLDDGTLGLVSATRYNAAGYDARLELFGSKDSIIAGLDERTPVTPLPEQAAGAPDPDTGPRGAYCGFIERFADAYDAELRAFMDVVTGRHGSPCPPEEALEAFYLAEACELSMREGRIVETREIRR